MPCWLRACCRTVVYSTPVAAQNRTELRGSFLLLFLKEKPQDSDEPGGLVLRACRPSKEVPKPRPGKVPKRVLRKVPGENGVPRKVPKKCSGVRSSVETSTGERTPKHFFSTFLGTPFSAGTFRSTLFGTFPGQGFGTSLDGRQARKFSKLTRF